MNNISYNRSKYYRLILFCVAIFYCFASFAQQQFNSDELFQQAREAAFNKKDYPLAIRLSRQALQLSPQYNDIRTFLGRIYTWNGKTDSARVELQTVLKLNPDYEDAASALADLEYWNDNYTDALTYCNQGLKYHPESTGLQIKKVKILKADKKYIQAYQVAQAILQKDPSNLDARSLIVDIGDAAALNKVGIGYDFTWFDKGYGDYLHKSPWHIFNVDYTRFTSIGSVTGRINRGERFGKTAFQGEIDAYPHLMKGLYAYTNIGFSDMTSVFPRFRMGASLYGILPKSFEAELGFRHLKFGSSAWIYVVGLSKYYKNFWFNGRVTLVPDQNTLSHSYTGTMRYYFGGTDDYFYGSVGYGLSPDNENVVLAFNNESVKLVSKKVSVGYKRSIRKLNIISVSASWLNEDYIAGQKGNQLNMSVSFQKRF